MILVTGANGQIGTVLTEALRGAYGDEQVLATDIKKPEDHSGLFEMLDILNTQRIIEIVGDYNITTIYHLAAILSANGEWNPQKTWNINLNGSLSILELARAQGLRKVFFPSTIAAKGFAKCSSDDIHSSKCIIMLCTSSPGFANEPCSMTIIHHDEGIILLT